MKISLSSSIALVAALIGTVQAGLFPTSPAPKQVLIPGSKVPITWQSDTTTPAIPKTGNIDVYFMTGSDQAQTKLQTIGSVPVTATTLDWTVPQVDPAGLIYFLMFQSGTAEWWTTRFIVAMPDGTYPPPPTVTYASGKNPGGVGKIVNATTPAATPAPDAGTPGSAPAGNAPAGNSSAPVAGASSNSAPGAAKPGTTATPTKTGAAVMSSRPDGIVAAGLALALSVGLMLAA